MMKWLLLCALAALGQAETDSCEAEVARVRSGVQEKLDWLTSQPLLEGGQLKFQTLHTIIDKLNAKVMCSSVDSEKVRFEQIVAGTAYLTAENSELLCRTCRGVFQKLKEATTGLGLALKKTHPDLNPEVVPMLLEQLPISEELCAKLLDNCEAVSSTPSPDLQCVECKVCETTLLVMQIQIFHNNAFKNDLSDAIQNKICPLLLNETSAEVVKECQEFTPDIVAATMSMMHELLHPQTFCKLIGACTADPIESSLLHCVGELCLTIANEIKDGKIKDVIELVCNQVI